MADADLPFPIAQTDTHYPRNSDDAVAVLNILRRFLPPELSLIILDHSACWLRSRVSVQESRRFSEQNFRDRTPYLVSEPIQGERFPVHEIKVDLWYHDEVWMANPESPWTWFELGIHRPPGREDIARDLGLLVTNIRVDSHIKHHQVVYRRGKEHPWIQDLQADDQLSVIPRARFSGWINFTKAASIEIYTDPF